MVTQVIHNTPCLCERLFITKNTSVYILGEIMNYFFIGTVMFHCDIFKGLKIIEVAEVAGLIVYI